MEHITKDNKKSKEATHLVDGITGSIKRRMAKFSEGNKKVVRRTAKPNCSNKADKRKRE